MDTRLTVIFLKTASAVVIGFGLAIALAAIPAANGPTAFLIDLVFWPIDGDPALDAPATRLLCAIAGGVLTGWGVLLWLIATRLLPQEPAVARTFVYTSIGIWFVVDSAASIASGAPINALLNIGFLMSFVVPLKLLKPAGSS